MRELIAAVLALPVLTASADATPRCGAITPAGERLAHILDDSDVAHCWLAGWHVDWRTGEVDRAEPGGPEAKTHCSAFVAAMAERLRIYVLRPPEHRQNLLANAQMLWLRDHGAEQGWRALGSYSTHRRRRTGASWCWRRSSTLTDTGPATSRSCVRARSRVRSWIATARRRRRPGSGTPSAPQRRPGSVFIAVRGSQWAWVNCAITRSGGWAQPSAAGLANHTPWDNLAKRAARRRSPAWRAPCCRPPLG